MTFTARQAGNGPHSHRGSERWEYSTQTDARRRHDPNAAPAICHSGDALCRL